MSEEIDIYFKSDYTIAKMTLVESLPAFSLPSGQPNCVTLLFRPHTLEEIESGFKKENARCIVSTLRRLPPKLVSMFQSLAKNEVPKGSDTDGLIFWLDQSGRIKENHGVPISSMPPILRDFVLPISKEFSDSIAHVVGLLRWRCGLEGPHDPIGNVSVGLLWSLDGSNWALLSDLLVDLSLEIPVTPSVQQCNEVADLLRQDIREPFGHQLFREAWQQRFGNLRSALVIGIAAAEVGFKECVADTVPDARWLVEHVPSPPLVRILQQYLPILPTKINGTRAIPPPEDILKTLKRGVELRNQVVHVSNERLDRMEVREILLAVRDMLLMLDHYRGFSWSIERARDNVRTSVASASHTR